MGQLKQRLVVNGGNLLARPCVSRRSRGDGIAKDLVGVGFSRRLNGLGSRGEVVCRRRGVDERRTAAALELSC